MPRRIRQIVIYELFIDVRPVVRWIVEDCLSNL